MPIVTQRREIPWSWAFVIALPWVGPAYAETVARDPLTFTLRKHLNDPAAIAFLSSLNTLFNFAVGALAAYLSDHIWTRWGARKPFIVVSFIGAALVLAAIPLARNVWQLAALIALFQFFVDLARPWEALFYDVVPAHQRGRATMARMIFVQVATLFLSAVLVGQFDTRYGMAGPLGEITGEHVLYWCVGAVLLALGLLVAGAVRETPPAVPPRWAEVAARWRPQLAGASLVQLARDLFGHRQMLAVYALYLCPVLAHTPQTTMRALMQTEQFGLSKADLGRLAAAVMPIGILVFAPLAGVLADRMPRLWMFRIGIAAPLALQLAFFVYARWWVDYRVPFGVFVAQGVATGFFQSWLWAVWGALVFDYVPAARRGTFTAGILLVAGLVTFVLTNLAGQWVNAATAWLGPRGGGDHDYSAIYVLTAITGTLALGITFWFGREVRHGRVTANPGSREAGAARGGT